MPGKKKHNTGLIKIYQVIGNAYEEGGEHVIITRLSRDECEKWLETKADYSDYMSTIILTIREVWTNLSASKIKEMIED